MNTTALPDSPLVRLPRLGEAYFAAVDRMDLAATLACFTPDARFTIATYDTVYQGRDTGLRGMFERLNTRYARVWHGARSDHHFAVVPGLPAGTAGLCAATAVRAEGHLDQLEARHEIAPPPSGPT